MPKCCNPSTKAARRSSDTGFSSKAEQAAGALEIALPQRMAGIGGQGGIEDPGHFRPRRQPLR